MKHLLIILMLISSLLISNQIKAQTTNSPIKSISIVPNFIQSPSLSIDVQLQLDSNESINSDYYTEKDKRPQFNITYSGKEYDSNCIKVEVYSKKTGIGFKIKGLNNEFIQRFKAKDNEISLQVISDINIQLIKNNVTDSIIIKKDIINNLIKNNLSITDSLRSQYISALNNFYYHENMFDFGFVPSNDSTSTSYFLTFNFQNRYSFQNLLKCSSNINKNPPHLFWNLTGRVSTNFKDSLNFINYYPLNLQFSNYNSTTPYELNFKFGNEANQTFSNKRAVVNGEYTCIIPNLINLTTAQSNRLRLKPILSLGIKGYYDYSNDTTHYFSGQGYLNLHYYIPVFNNYAIIIDESPFYDFSAAKNPNHKIQNNYTITIGTELPKTGVKAMFKYVNGTSNITAKQGKAICIGLLMDLFQEKNK